MIEVKVSKYIPEGYAVMVGTLCKKCKKPFDPLTLCAENIPYGHVPDVVILKNIGEAQQSVHPTKATPRWFEVLVNKFRVLCSRLRG